MVLYPDNTKRASRVDQLVTSTAVLQTDIKQSADAMDAKNVKMRPILNQILTKAGYDNIDDLIAKATAQLTPEERKAFEALLQSAKNFQTHVDYVYFAAGLLMLPEGFVVTGKIAIAIARFALKSGVLRSIANVFRAAEISADAAASLAEGLTATAAKAEQSAQEASEIGEAGVEVAEAVGMLNKFMGGVKLVGALGFVLTAVLIVIEAIKGADQKKKLIEAIHSLQPGRLTVNYFKKQAESIQAQMFLIDIYFEELAQPKPDPTALAKYAAGIMKSIQEEDDKIDIDKLETDLEAQDRTASNFYGSDDLGHADVVLIAQGQTANA